MLNKETELEYISRKSGMKPISCKCDKCKSQCQIPCIGTPSDMLKIIDAGFEDSLVRKVYNSKGDVMIAIAYDPIKKACTFFENGLCKLHDLGLKPTVGKLSHHSTDASWYRNHKPVHHFVTKFWDKSNDPKVLDALKKIKKAQ